MPSGTLLADEVRLDVVARKEMNGRKEVQTYFHNYSSTEGWRLQLGFVDRQPAILLHDTLKGERPIYFISLKWIGGEIVFIRDFRYAPP